jgi:predicted RNA-binding Zn-ribbon protein involved in translation (DUF1610 family)
VTSETRILIDLTDIRAVEFECPKCDARISYPVDKRVDRLADKCPNCYEPWIQENANRFPGSPSVADGIMRTMEMLHTIATSSDVKARVRLHIPTIQKG